MKYTLKLDASFRPLSIIDSVKAFGMVSSGRARVVEEYEEEIYPEIKAPLVICVQSYVRDFSFTKSCNRNNIAWRDNYVCQYCGDRYSLSELTMDHIMPKSRGGPKLWENIVAACKNCNGRKEDKTPEEAGMSLIREPRRPYVDFFDLKSPCHFHPEWLKYQESKKKKRSREAEEQ